MLHPLECHLRDPLPRPIPTTADFRKLMGLFATGVCVVAAEPDEGAIAAMTINSFVSVSLEPMLVCWSLHNSSSQFAVFADGERFAVSILSADQGVLARRYAARGDTQLSREDFARTAEGLPVITGALGHFECRRWAAHPAGDHTMILGEVTGLSAPALLEEKISPLGFFNGKFCSIGE